MGGDTGPLVEGQKAYILLELKGIVSEEKMDEFDEKLKQLLDSYNGKRLGTIYSTGA
jgi:hypothetical protein